jgi:predicted ATPase
MALDYTVYFARLQTATPPDRPAIILSPSHEEWDDFGFKTQFHCRIFERAAKSLPDFHIEVRLGFLELDEDPKKVVMDFLEKEGTSKVVRAPHRFFTMLQSMEEYREFMMKFDPKSAQRIFTALNDVVAALRRRPRPKWLQVAVKTRVFRQSFLRSSESFYAYHNAGPLLDGVEFEPVGRLTNELRVTFELPTFANPHRLLIRFRSDTDVPRRIAVLIGKNGAGKSQTLYRIARSLLKDDAVVRGLDGEKPQVSRVIAVSPPSVTRGSFPRQISRNATRYRRLVIGPSRGGDGLGSALAQLAHSRRATTRGLERWHLFIDAIGAVAPAQTLFVTSESQTGDAESFPLSHLGSAAGRDELQRITGIAAEADVFRQGPRGQEIPLSTGETTFIRLAAQICLHIDVGTLLLLDEPETHFHPNLISRFTALLHRLLELTGSFAVIATHSPHFVREVPQSQVHILRRTEDGRFENPAVSLRTFGADVGSISEFVFGDDLYGSLVERLRTRMNDDPSLARALLKQLLPELPSEVVIRLRRDLESGRS